MNKLATVKFNEEVESHIRKNVTWNKLPPNVKQLLGNSAREYEKCVLKYSIANQLRFRGNLVRQINKEEHKYYEQLLEYSQEHLMLFPYHLSDIVVGGMRLTPFQYYTEVIQLIMEQEKSYDALPNFTAADCLRLLGIGRNQYIDLMNQYRTTRKIFRKKSIRDLLPRKPVRISIEPWWLVNVGFVTDDDIKAVTPEEKELIDQVIDNGPTRAGSLHYGSVHGLYRKGLIYLTVLIEDTDCVIVPPLEGFVMNRILGDYFETLLYKIFVSIDEHTSVSELSNILEIDLELVKNAVSMYCRLGFAFLKPVDLSYLDSSHVSWKTHYVPRTIKRHSSSDGYYCPMSLDLSSVVNFGTSRGMSSDPETPVNPCDDSEPLSSPHHSKRVAFLFDSTLTAFLMMGNLCPGLKSHAVTMFEVGKLPDESIDGLLVELGRIDNEDVEGEAHRYLIHALCLKNTIYFMRKNRDLTGGVELGLDLIRCESLQSLDSSTCSRLLNKNYELIVSVAPLTYEIRPIDNCFPPHIGPAIPEVNSVWFKMFLYHVTGFGPPSLLLCKGSKVKWLPQCLAHHDRFIITTWGHDPVVVPGHNILVMLNESLTHSAVLLQAPGWQSETEDIITIPFPIADADVEDLNIYDKRRRSLVNHEGIKRLREHFDLQTTCGYISLMNLKSKNIEGDEGDEAPRSAEGCRHGLESSTISWERLDQQQVITNPADWTLLELSFGVPLFDQPLNAYICTKIQNYALWRKDSLDKLVHSNGVLALNLLDFIDSCQSYPIVPDMQEPGTRKFGTEIPLPTRNLLFVGSGCVVDWDSLR